MANKKKLNTFIMEGTKSVSHLLFVDDLIIFTKANVKLIKEAKKILQRFYDFFRLKANSIKRCIHFFIATPNQEELT